jgi:hypothetical protein
MAENRELNEQIQLGLLLQKQRSPDAMTRVEGILQETLTIPEKISRIQQLDAAAESGKPFRGGIRRRQSEPEAQFDPAGVTAPVFREIKRNRRRIKRNPAPPGFFRYLVSHARQIQRFGQESHVLVNRVLSFHCRMDPQLPQVFRERLQKGIAAPLLPSLTVLIQQGWKFLSKSEYNLIVLTAELCSAILGLELSRPSMRERYFLEKLTTVENLYLSLAGGKGEYIQALQHTLREAGRSLPEHSEQLTQASTLLNRLLLPDLILPSLRSIILGANMVRHRQYLELEQLINPASGPVVARDDFEAPQKIYLEIRRFQWEREQELHPLIDLYEKVLATTIFLPVKGEAEEVLLRNVYDSIYGEGRFQKHQGNIGWFISAWADLLLNEMQPLLSAEVELEGLSAALFGRDYFSMEFDRLEQARQRLEEPVVIMPTFPRDRFVRLKQSRKGAIPNEALIIEQTDEIIRIAIEIGRKLQEVLRYRLPLEFEHPEFPPLEPLFVRKRNYFLPHEGRRIEAVGYFRNSTVVEALNQMIRILFQLASFMMDPEFSSLTQREKRLKKKIADLAAVLYRIASQSEFERIRDEYDLAPFLKTTAAENP